MNKKITRREVLRWIALTATAFLAACQNRSQCDANRQSASRTNPNIDERSGIPLQPHNPKFS